VPRRPADSTVTSGALPAVPADDRAARRTRRRFARRQWRRRWLAWRRVVAVLVVVALVGGAVWALWFSSMLSVRAVEVTGTSRLKPGQVRRAADVRLGGPLVSVDLGAVRARIAALAPVEHVEVSRKCSSTSPSARRSR
jgi:cell division protein FtsQ